MFRSSNLRHGFVQIQNHAADDRPRGQFNRLCPGHPGGLPDGQIFFRLRRGFGEAFAGVFQRVHQDFGFFGFGIAGQRRATRQGQPV